MGIRIEFNTDQLRTDEAAGLIALLATVSPKALEALTAQGAIGSLTETEHRIGDVSVTHRTRGAAPVTEAQEAAADNGYEEPQDANAVFPAPTADTAQLDKAGLPYDKRIHSNPPSIIGTGLWRKKKGVGNDLVESVTAELRQTYPKPTADAGTAAPQSSAPSTSAAPAPPSDARPTTAAAPTATAVAPVAPPSSAPATETAPQAFARTIQKMNKAQTAGKLTVLEVSQACEAAGVKEARGLLGLGDKSLDAILTFEAMIDAAIAAAG